MSDIYYDTYMEGEDEQEEKSPFRKILSIILKTVAILLLLVMFFLLFYRIFEMKEPKNVGKLLWTEEIDKAFSENSQTIVNEKYKGKEYSFERETLTDVILTKKTDKGTETVTVKRSEYYSSDGFHVFSHKPNGYCYMDNNGTPDDESDDKQVCKKFEYYSVKGSPAEGKLRANHLYLIPKAKQVQLTFRYKKDILDKDQLNGKLFNDNNMPFHFTLTDDTGKTYTNYRFETTKRGVYRYVTLIFDEVNLFTPKELVLNILYLNSKNRETSLEMTVYDSNEKGEQCILEAEYQKGAPRTDLLSYPANPSSKKGN